MIDVTTYTDYRNRPTRLTDEELAWFHAHVDQAKRATGYQVEIITFDHDLLEKKHRDALGCCVTQNPGNQLGEGVDTFITIDCYFIHESFRHEVYGDFTLESKSLMDVIAHELAHLTVWRHGKKHTAMTDKLLRQIQAA